MQDPAIFQPMKPQFPEQEQLKCPRCDSSNTKFCYYNNYNLSQPRHFCKNCRRYWTKGGTLRNIPVGGGTRKNTKRPSSSSSKRSSSSSSSSSPSLAASSTPTTTTNSIASTSLGMQKSGIFGSVVEQDRQMLDIGGSFSSLLASNVQFGSVFEGLNPCGSGAKMVQMGETRENLNSCLDLDMGSGRNLGLEVQGSNGSENFLAMQNGDSGCWSGGGGGGNGWPDLAIYTTPETLVVKKRSMNDSSSM